MRPGSKRPLTERGFKDATRNVGKVVQWWTNEPDANIGVPTGAVSGLTVIDVDIKPRLGKHGTQANRAAGFRAPAQA